jgi:hypothetical protein
MCLCPADSRPATEATYLVAPTDADISRTTRWKKLRNFGDLVHRNMVLVHTEQVQKYYA